MLNMQSIEITMKEQRKKRERRTKKSYSIAKKNLVKSYSFMMFSKKSDNIISVTEAK